MSNNIDALIAGFPGTLQENALRQSQQQLAGQTYQQNALKLQQQTGGLNALANIYANKSNINPDTGLPNPGAMGPLITANPPQGLDFLEAISKMNEERQRAAMTQFRMNEYYTNIYHQSVVDPLLRFADSLDPHLPSDVREQKIATEKDRLEKTSAQENAIPDSVRDRWSSIQPRIPEWAAQSPAWQNHMERSRESWELRTDPGTGNQYMASKMYPGMYLKPDMKTPYTPSGYGEPAGESKPWTVTYPGPGGEPQTDTFERDVMGRAFKIDRGPNGEKIPYTIPPNYTKLAPESTRATTPGLEASKTLEIRDKNDEVVRTVMGREARDKTGFVDSTSNAPVLTPEEIKAGFHIRETTPSASSGGRAGAQVLRQQIGAREVLSDLQNAVSLPVGTTTGLLGGYVPGISILGALRGDLSRKLTDKDALLMRASMAGITRELSILESPVYGGSYAAKQIDPLIPAGGDPMDVTIFKLARIGQSTDNALEALSKSNILSPEQKKYAIELRKAVREAIPWTSAQALAFAEKGQHKESFGDFVKREGLSKDTGAGAPRSWPLPKEYANDPDGTTYNNSAYVKRGNQLVPNSQ